VELVTDAIAELEGAVEELGAVLALLEAGGNSNGDGSAGPRREAASASPPG
ncbi:MAG: hypothetical protein HY000_38390, partial [Planctomycetes bacterium]|nr:hypothetical protein [Planctomycetota bacterium]